MNVFFTGACLTRETLGQDPEDHHLPTSTSTSASTPIPSPGQDITDTLPVKVCSTRRRNRDVTEELSLPLPSRRRYRTVHLIVSVRIAQKIRSSKRLERRKQLQIERLESREGWRGGKRIEGRE